MSMFDADPYTVPPAPPAPAKSYTVRLTKRRQTLLAAGVHPTTRRPLLADSQETCGTCAHHFWHRRSSTYHKCELAAGGVTGGPVSDVRVGWRACALWNPTTIDVYPDPKVQP